MGKYSDIKYSDMYEIFCKELFCETEKFENDPSLERLKCVKELMETIGELQEIEAGSAMREFAEDRWGYNMDDGFSGMPPYYGIHGPYNNVPIRRRGNRSRSMQGDYNSAPNTHYGYPTYGPNRGNMQPNGMPDYINRDRMSREDGKIGYGDDEPYMLRQENGKPRMTPFAMHTGSIPKKLTDEQYKEWMSNLENDDGTNGGKYSKQEIENAAKKFGIDYNEYGLSALELATNVMYSDYCEVASEFGVNRIDFYMKLADAFLNDEDASVDGAEKLSVYYHTIVK